MPGSNFMDGGKIWENIKHVRYFFGGGGGEIGDFETPKSQDLEPNLC